MTKGTIIENGVYGDCEFYMERPCDGYVTVLVHKGNANVHFNNTDYSVEQGIGYTFNEDTGAIVFTAYNRDVDNPQDWVFEDAEESAEEERIGSESDEPNTDNIDEPPFNRNDVQQEAQGMMCSVSGDSSLSSISIKDKQSKVLFGKLLRDVLDFLAKRVKGLGKLFEGDIGQGIKQSIRAISIKTPRNGYRNSSKQK